MNSGPKPLGFTIIEVMIVLAIGSFLFIAAAVALTGDQNQTEFDTGVRQIFSELQSLSSDVQNGNYSANILYSCNSSSGLPTFSAVSSSQGTNIGCVYLGKALQFNPSSNSSYYYVYSLVGDQFDTTSSNLSLPPAFPFSSKVLDSGINSIYPPPNTQTINLPDQFKVSKISYSGNPSGVDSDLIGFYNVQTNSLASNSSISNQVFIIPEASSASSIQVVNDINNDILGNSSGQYIVNLNNPVTVCFTSPLENNQYVKISFNNQTNSTDLTLNYGYGSC